MRFAMDISTKDNDAMQSRNDVAFVLDNLARKLRSNTQVMAGDVLDPTGTKIGTWWIEEEELTPVFGTPIVDTSPDRSR